MEKQDRTYKVVTSMSCNVEDLKKAIFVELDCWRDIFNSKQTISAKELTDIIMCRLQNQTTFFNFYYHTEEVVEEKKREAYDNQAAAASSNWGLGSVQTPNTPFGDAIAAAGDLGSLTPASATSQLYNPPGSINTASQTPFTPKKAYKIVPMTDEEVAAGYSSGGVLYL